MVVALILFAASIVAPAGMGRMLAQTPTPDAQCESYTAHEMTVNGGTITVSLPADAPDVAPTDVEVVILDEDANSVTATVAWTKVTSGSPRPDCPTLPVWQGTFTQPDNWRTVSVRLTTPGFTVPEPDQAHIPSMLYRVKTSRTDYSRDLKAITEDWRVDADCSLNGNNDLQRQWYHDQGLDYPYFDVGIVSGECVRLLRPLDPATVEPQTISATDENESFTSPTPRSVPQVDPATAAAGAERRQKAEEAEQAAASKPVWWCRYDPDAGAVVINTSEGVKWAAATAEQAAEGGCE